MSEKRNGPMLALIVLVVALGCAFIGYDWFSNRDQTSGTIASIAEETSQSQEGASELSDAMLLADYDATVYTDLGEPVLLSALADGRPLVINFWATWCGYCKDEMPDYLKIYTDYKDRVSFAFVDAVDGEMERAEDGLAWLAENGFSELPDYYDQDLEAASRFGVYAYPTTVIVSADGEIMTVAPGRIDAALLRGALNTLVQ